MAKDPSAERVPPEGGGFQPSFQVDIKGARLDYFLLAVFSIYVDTAISLKRCVTAILHPSFALRGYDSVQLAAARTLQEATQEELHFTCFDTRLRKAAKVLGMLTQAAQ